jgi:glycosyltransferase involved in cell wall biosynthesis
MFNNMKVALVQDWFVVNGGAEKVFREFINLYPNADVFALVDFLSDQDRQDVLNGKHARTSFIQKLPNAKSHFRNFLPFFPMAISGINLSKYDVIISSSYAVAKGVIKRPGQTHICYCHSPVRYAWDLRQEYVSRLKGTKRIVANWILDYIARWDLKTTNRVDHFIANSKNVAERIRRIYGRDSTVIYPPVDIEGFSPQERKDDYYFTSMRVVPYKRLDVIVDAFRLMPNRKLVVAGDGPALKKIRSGAPSNVEFLGFITKQELVTKMQQARAFILAAEEDFGITSLEAQASLTPVIALRSGGYLETVQEGKTGLFFDEQSATSICEAVETLEKRKQPFAKTDFLNNVKSFAADRFRKEIKQFVEQHV